MPPYRPWTYLNVGKLFIWSEFCVFSLACLILGKDLFTLFATRILKLKGNIQKHYLLFCLRKCKCLIKMDLMALNVLLA